MSDSQESEFPVINILPIEDEESEKEQEPPAIPKDKRGRRITQKKLEAIKKAQQKSIDARAKKAEKAKLYDDMKSKEIDYDKLSELVANKIVIKKQEKIQKEPEPTPEIIIDSMKNQSFRQGQNFSAEPACAGEPKFQSKTIPSFRWGTQQNPGNNNFQFFRK